MRLRTLPAIVAYSETGWEDYADGWVTSFVTVSAHTIVDGFGSNEIVVDLTAENEPGFEVQR